MHRNYILTAALFGCLLGSKLAVAQSATKLPLNDLSAFTSPASNWKIAADVSADMGKPNTLITKPGTGILVCNPVGYDTTRDLITSFEHGDADLELDFMMAKGSNSGIYLQGQYEVQLQDSWGVTNPKSSDVGSIYERWDESRPDGRKGYDGHPARQNAGKAPGLWQHLKISFQAPRFNASGAKTANAKFLRVELNGVLIQEDVEVAGPTRGSMTPTDKAMGPLRIQGDHGAVAFKNISYTLFGNRQPRLSNLTYEFYKGKFQNETAFGGTPPESKGPLPNMTTGMTQLTNDFAVRYLGTLHVDTPGDYTIMMSTAGGAGQVKINNQPLNKWSNWSNSGKITLPAGDLPFEATYSKLFGGPKPDVQLMVSGPGIRQFALTPTNTGGQEEADPILVTAETNTVLRSFMDLPTAKNDRGRNYRVTHGISVGSPQQVHYTYDADNGSVVQVWRGSFLDATPMWENRGDGSSRPLGAVNYLVSKPQIMLARLASAQAPWPTDTTGSGFRPKGYQLDDNDRPTFRYMTGASMVTDQIRVLPEGHGLQRELTVAQPGTGLYARIIEGTTIEAMPNNTYLVDGKAYMIQLADAGSTPIIRTSNGRQELIVPVSGKLTYSILF